MNKYIRRNGPQPWTNVHRTVQTDLADLFDVYNPGPTQTIPGGPLGILKLAGENLDLIAGEAAKAGKHVRGAGSSWALSDIAITDGWLVNTENLNGAFNISSPYFHPSYAAAKRDYLVVAQCGATIGWLNTYLEFPSGTSAIRRAMKTSGIGNGQTVAGAVGGSTHGAALRFGSTPDWVVGIHLVIGSGQGYWIERASEPVMSDNFATKIGCTLLRDDLVFNAAVVNLGSFGIVAALALETDPIYHLKFPPHETLTLAQLDAAMKSLSSVKDGDNTAPYHYEFVFNPYVDDVFVAASAKRVPFSGNLPPPKPRWQIGGNGLAPGDHLPAAALKWLPFPEIITKFQFDWYLKNALLDNVTGTPGQMFSATISHFEGTVESAFAVSLEDVVKVVEISSRVVKDLKIPSISQVRIVRSTRTLLAFTRHSPRSAVFEFAMLKDEKFQLFEETLAQEFTAAGIPYTFHWSKNSGLSAPEVEKAYTPAAVAEWKAARDRIFQGHPALKAAFTNDHLRRCGLA